MRIISTERSQVLAARISEKLGVPLAEMKFARFPDGEMYLQCGDLDDETLIISSIVNSDMLVQTLLAIDAADRSRNTLVIPYLGYARQDRRFARRAVSARLQDPLAVSGRLWSISMTACWTTSVPAKDITIAPAIGMSATSTEELILAPDEARSSSRHVAAVGGWDCDFLRRPALGEG